MYCEIFYCFSTTSLYFTQLICRYELYEKSNTNRNTKLCQVGSLTDNWLKDSENFTIILVFAEIIIGIWRLKISYIFVNSLILHTTNSLNSCAVNIVVVVPVIPVKKLPT